MNYMQKNEKMLKHNLKNKRRITLSLIVSFLITGGFGFVEEEVMARDLRARNRSANDIKPDTSGGPSMSTSANGTDVVQINNPNSGGISHNKFIDFSVGNENAVIFNNNSTTAPFVTKTGGIVTHNPYISQSASAILNEVTGNRGSNINGTIEIAGQRADFILANENGITVNGGGFVNTNGVTLTTGKPTVSGADINLNVQKGNVLIEGAGVGTAGNYFNIISKTIELKGQIAPFDGEKDADITLVAGQNDVTLRNKNEVVLNGVTGHEKGNLKYGIYADNLGAMYGKNIKLISTTEGLGVRHEGLIRGSGDIEILSNGDITIGGIVSEKDVRLKGKGDLATINGSYKNSGVEYNYSIFAGNGVELGFEGDITLENLIQSDRAGIKIVAKNLTLKANSTAKILSQNGLKIQVEGTMNLEALLTPVMPGRSPSKPPLVVLKNSNGVIVVKDPETGRILNSNEVEWESTGIYGNQIDIQTGNLINNTIITSGTNTRKNYINIDVANQLTNNKIISSSGNLNVKARKIVNEKNAVIKGAVVAISANDLTNKGELRQNTGVLGETVDRGGKISIDIQNGNFKNSGVISGYNVEIIGKGFILNEKEGRIESSTEDYPKGMGSIVINATTLENNGTIQSYGQGIRNDIEINTETLLNAFGAKIISKKGNLKITTTVGDLLNSGEFFADADIMLISEKNIKNSGKIGGENIGIVAEKGTFENYGKVAAVKKLTAHINNLINAGSPEEITKYLSSFNSFIRESYDNVLQTIVELEKRLETAVNLADIEALEEALKYYRDLERELVTLKYEIEKVGSLGILSGENIELKSNESMVNKGIIKSNTDISLEAGINVTNNGVIEGNKNITLKAGGDIKNTQRIYAGKTLEISGKSFVSTGDNTLLDKYVDLLQKYDEKKLEEAENKIKELEKKLDTLTDKDEIKKIKTELEKYRVIKTEQAALKAEIITIAGLGIIEAENVSIVVEETIENNGIIVTDQNLKLEALGSVVNSGNISVGKKAEISGDSFINKVMTVGGEFIAKINNRFESDSLKVQDNIMIEAGSVNINKDLSSGANTDITLSGNNSKIEFLEDSTINIKNNLNVTGGAFQNNGEVIVGGQLSVDSSKNIGDKSFKNIGSIDVGSDIDIKSQGIYNNGDIVSNGKLIANAGTESFNTANKLQAKNGADITSNGFINSGEAIFGGDVVISAGSGIVENKSLEVKGNTVIKTTSDFKNLEKLQNTGTLTVSAKNFENNGNILNTGLNVSVSEKIKNTNKIEVSGNIDLKGTGDGFGLENSDEILATGSGIIDIKGELENTGKIATGNNLNIKADKVINKANGNIQGAGDLDIQVKNGLTNEASGKVLGGNINIDATTISVNNRVINNGEIHSNGTLTLNLGSNDADVILNDSKKISSQDTMTIITGGKIENIGRLQNYGGLEFKAEKDIINKGMLVSNGNVFLTTKGSLLNDIGSTIWAGKDIIIDAVRNIANKFQATIESKGSMLLKGESLINEAGTIKAGKNLDLNVNKIENKSNVTGSGYVEIDKFVATEKYKYEWIGINKYELIDIEMPIYKSDLVVTDKATIQSGGNLSIQGKDGGLSDVLNSSGTISAAGNIKISGDVKNETINVSMTLDEYLSNIKVTLKWENRTVGDAWLAGGTNATGNLKDLLKDVIENPNLLNCLKQLANQNVELKKLISSALGSDWMGQNTIDIGKYNGNSKYQFFATNGSASVLAGGSINHVIGVFENIGGERAENQKIDVNIGENKVNGTQSNLGISVNDPNSITEVDGVKQVHNVEIQKGEVTINGVTISANTGGTVTAIAIAGTINPVIFITIPVGNNGIFIPATPRPDGTVPYKYETNLDFIDLSKYYGSNYFFTQAGYDPKNTSTVIGDAYYEKELINTTIREGLGYAGEVGTDQIKTMLDNAILVREELNLVLGMPLTPEQINNLKEDIIWYVEMEVEGEVVLVPQVYFGNETRLKIAAQDQGGGIGSTVKAGGDINIDASKVENSNGTISAGGNISIKSESGIVNSSTSGLNGGISAGGNTTLEAKENIDMIGGSISGNDVSLKSEGNITIESTLGYDEKGNQKVSNSAGVQGKGDISINAGGDANIIGGVIESTGDGNIELSGKNVNILDQNITNSSFETSTSGITETSTSTSSSTSSGSVVVGKNITINSENDVNIKGSEVVATENVAIDAKNDVNILDGQNYTNEVSKSKTSGFQDGLLTIGSSDLEKTTSKSMGSTVGGLGGVDVKSGGDTTIKGSDLIAGENGISIKSSGDVNILDGQDSMSVKSNSNIYNTIGFTSSSEDTKSTTSKGSNMTTIGDLNIESGGNVKVVGSNLTSLGDTNISAEKDVVFEAGKNTYESTKNSLSVGVTSAGASAGAGGSSATANWDSVNGGYTDIVNGDSQKVASDSQNLGAQGKSGKNFMDSLATVQTTVGVSVNKSSEKSTTWTDGDVTTGGDLNIKSKGTTDIGGSNFTTGGDFNIEAKDIETTKYVDVVEKESSGINVGVKVANTTTSNIADTVNKGMQIADTVADPNKELNGALTGAQVAGSVTNIIFGDLVGNTTSVTGEIGVNNSSSKSEKENTTSIASGGNINFKTTGGDINLKGVNMDAEGVNLDSAGNVNIAAAKETYTETTSGTNVSGGVIFSAGVSLIDGAYAQGGVIGNVQHSEGSKNNETNNGSNINAKNITIKSEKDTNIIGSNVAGDNVNLEIKGNLNVETIKDKVDESRVEGWAGGDLSIGVATNTIGTGDVGISAGGGETYKKGDSVNKQAGIVAKNTINAKIDGDANIIGGVLGSETGEGNIKIGGSLNIEDVKSDLNAGGQIIGISGGTKGGGIQGEVADIIDQEKTAKGVIGLNPGNITVGDITINGKAGNKEDINTDMENSLIVDKDVHQGGGTFSGTASIVDVGKKKKNKDVEISIIPPAKENKIEIKKLDTQLKKTEVTGVKVDSKKAEITGTKVDSKKAEVKEVKIDLKNSVITEVKVDSKKAEVIGAKKEIPELKLPNVEAKVELPIPKFPDSVDSSSKNTNTKNTEVVNGYTKNPTTGKWEKVNQNIGAVLTNGSIRTKEALDGIRNGINSTVKTNNQSSSTGSSTGAVAPPQNQPISQGTYQKNPATGKWEISK